MTNTELVELLREARNSVALEVAACTAFRVSDADKRVLDLLKRIDAALAAHDAVQPSEEKVEWEEMDTDPLVFKARKGNVLFTMDQRVDGRWNWQAIARHAGVVNTLDEAQRAAFAAARGMR